MFTSDVLSRAFLWSSISQPGVIVETVDIASTDGWTVEGEFRVLVDRTDRLVMVANTRVGLGRFGPWRYALTRQGMDAAARRYLPGARFTGDDATSQASNPTMDEWRRVYRAA